jgi:pyruvate/2-oxoglutarate dehydrogenase complex dihydrolipoamide acyltransferase (E2) component
LAVLAKQRASSAQSGCVSPYGGYWDKTDMPAVATAAGALAMAVVAQKDGTKLLPERRVGQAVVAHDGQAAVRRVLPLSLTFDHRVVTGGEAARFLMALKLDLERAS